MATLPKATTTVVDTAKAIAGGLDTICVFAPVPTSADITPRIFGNPAAVYAQHGYSEGVEYVDFHTTRTDKPVIFVGLPIATPGVIGRENTSGRLTGTSTTTLVAGGSGVLAEHDGQLSVAKGGTRGTDQIMLTLSLDGGRSTKTIRLGTATTYTIPYIGVRVDFGAGTFVTGEVLHTWHGTGPRSAAADWITARTNLAAQLKLFRSIILIGDVQNKTESGALLTQLNAYKTANERSVYGRASTIDRLPQAALAQAQQVMTGNPSLTFLEVGGTGDTITRSAGSFIADGFVNGDTIRVTGSASNNVTGPVVTVTDLVLTLGTTDLANEGPVANVTVTAEPTLTFAEVGASGDTITRSRGSWLADGFRIGDKPVITGTASNNITCAQGLATVTATVLTLGTDDLAAEVIGAFGVSVTAGQTKAAWMAAIDGEHETVNGYRLDLSAGRQLELSNFSGWNRRVPLAWVASAREFQHDLQTATWRKADGPTGGDLFDANGTLVEWDDRADGGAGCAARFTTARTWGNGPAGAFVALSLTRGDDASLLSQTHNVAVVNLAENVAQLNTENAVGRTLVLNDDGTATTDSLNTIQKEVNDALELALLTNRLGEGPRASKAVWVPSKTDIFNVPDATLTGVLTLNLNGTVHSVNTQIRVLSGGAA